MQASKKTTKIFIDSCNNQFIICFDASFSINDGKCIFGCASFYKSAIIYAKSANWGTCASSKKGEVHAILFTLNKAREFQFYNILLFTNFLEVVCAIKLNDDWILRSIVVDIFESAKRFVSIRFQHSFRVLNVTTHFLAKFCLKSNNVEAEFFYSFSN